MAATEKVRIDKYLWAIRLFKTRSVAVEAIEKGKVRLQGSPVKASRAVQLGDEYEVKNEARKWVIRVKGIIDKRVGFSEAILQYEDITPPEDVLAIQFQATAFNTGKRLSKIGRPTKKQRRDLEGYTDLDSSDAN